ncbi:PA3496 family putative envelope integrity protein [Atopomonas sediminilitoris]|uniref:PA3496 family putative envelope integrity protein n=1 Tax=Atopomonas sediminilitoris TaxID=2919919 RepID=UPI001F4F003F|nr:hypothetical protein [Atopomonas sediminilitoris]MCJ8169699.1 hypothetical protein [Atopomonas sediminilitoris]
MADSDTDFDDDDFVAEDDSEKAEVSPTTTKASNLTKRRQIDSMLAERRLKKLISDYDFD